MNEERRMKYDYFIAGRWRNHEAIREVLQKVRNSGKSAYCFIDNEYEGDGIKFKKKPADIELLMQAAETVEDWRVNPTFRQIYDNDMTALKNSEVFLMVLPAGLSAHMELGVAFGLGKKCYAIGQPEKTETLYLMFEELFPDVEQFIESQIGALQ